MEQGPVDERINQNEPTDPSRRSFLKGVAALSFGTVSTELHDSELTLLEQEFDFEIYSYPKVVKAVAILLSELGKLKESKISFEEVQKTENKKMRIAGDFLVRHLDSQYADYLTKKDIVEGRMFTPFRLGMLRDEASHKAKLSNSGK